ncbi:MAG: hypothetical protein AAFV49_01615 [Pseudomonadota bacterium]
MGNSNQPTCNAPITVDYPIDEYGFDTTECAVLDVMRRFFGAFAFPKSHAWLGAFAAAESRFGPQGAVLALRIAKTIQILRSNRTADFGFINPDCPCCRHRITAEERYFITTLHAVRRGQGAEATLNALFVCSGQDPAPLVAATKQLATDLASYEVLHPAN